MSPVPPAQPEISAPLIRSLRTYLATLPTEAKRLGAGLLELEAVRSVSFRPTPYPPRALAVVKDRSMLQCALEFEGDDGWQGNCGCAYGRLCAHLHATGQRLLDEMDRMPANALAHAHEPPIVPAEPSAPDRNRTRNRGPNAPTDDILAVVETYERLTGKTCDTEARSYLKRLSACDRMLHHANHTPFEEALARLLPSAHRHRASELVEALRIYAGRSEPGGAFAFWNRLALAFSDLGLEPPAFMAGCADLASLKASRAEAELLRSIETWTQSFARIAAQIATPSPAASRRRLRIVLTAQRIRWEASHAGTATDYVFLKAPEIRRLAAAPLLCAESLDPESCLLAAYAGGLTEEGERIPSDLRDLRTRQFLARILANPATAPLLVDEAGAPFPRDSRRVVWHFADCPDDAPRIPVSLALSDGTQLEPPFFHLPGTIDLYLSAHRLFSGPPPPCAFAESGELDGLQIPRGALLTPDAAAFAALAGMAMPQNCQISIAHEILVPLIRAHRESEKPDLGGIAREDCLLQVLAIGPDGTPRALLQPEGWNRHAPGIPDSSPQSRLVLDFSRVQALATSVLAMAANWDGFDYETSKWTVPLETASHARSLSDWLRSLGGEVSFECLSDLAALNQGPILATIDVDLRPSKQAEGIDWFDLRASLRTEDTELTPEERQQLYAARGAFVKLPRLGWRRMSVIDEAESLQRLEKLGMTLGDSGPGHSPYRLHALHLADDEDAVRVLPKDSGERILARASELLAAAPAELPPGLKAELRHYQVEGFRRLAFLATCGLGSVLADDMGLGKTLQAIAWLLWLAHRRAGDAAPGLRVLVVCPKSVVDNWLSETARFAPALTAATFAPRVESGTPRPATHLVVANYAQLRLHEDALCAETWDAVILDEGQYIKNPDTATAKAARRLDAAHRLVLTGTPVENRLLDLWSLFAFAMPGLLGSQASFTREYQDATDAAAARRRLAARVRPFLLRRTKKQVAPDLPARIEEDVVCAMDDEQETLYQAELKSARQALLAVRTERDLDAQRFNILQSLTRLRQICCDPRLINPEFTGKGSAKIDALFDLLEPILAEGHKVLIFSQFVGMLELIRDELKTRAIPRLVLTGETENRHELVLRFATDPTIQVFLLSLRAAGTGLNLMAASYVILYDPWWNPAVEAQAIDRTHRIGQSSQVIAYRLIARNSVEEKIRLLHREKRELADSVVDEESLTSVLDLENLRRILA